MKKLLTLWMLALLPCCINAQTDAEATEVLDKALAGLSDDSGIRADFGGTEKGFLLLKGEKVDLNNGNNQIWYDGKTQWSYVAQNEEVNISHPTIEEIQAINPYLILMRYKTDFNYTYTGKRTRNGVEGHEIILTPKQAGNRELIRLFISKKHRPLAMKIEQNGQAISEVNITNYQTKQKLVDEMFRFNKSLYPNVELIDMR